VRKGHNVVVSFETKKRIRKPVIIIDKPRDTNDVIVTPPTLPRIPKTSIESDPFVRRSKLKTELSFLETRINTRMDAGFKGLRDELLKAINSLK
jgi:hypothetical protein